MKTTKEDAINYLIGELKKEGTIRTHLIRDGHHSFGELYEHRIVLYIALCRIIALSNYKEFSGIVENPVWRSKYHSDGQIAFDGDWFVLGIFRGFDTQITYHLPIHKWIDTEFAVTLDKAPEWDGHTPEDVLKRLKNI